MISIPFITKILAFGTLASQILLVMALAYYVFFRKTHPQLAQWLKKRGLLLAFSVALISMAGSLFYSNVAGFAPCDLCWFQRIFMYPLVFVLGLALYRKDKGIIDYALVLAVVGLVVAAYHNVVYYSVGGLSVLCDLAGSSGVSCVKRYVFELGYVTIPMMALTAFVVVIALLLLARQQKA